MNVNNETHSPTSPIQEESPDWLRTLLTIGTAVFAAYIVGRLLEELFGSDEHERMPRVFISHSWKNDRDYWKLMSKFERNDFDFYNHSIDIERPLDVATSREIEKGIKNKMKGCSTVLVLAGSYANRYWIRKEVEIANKMGKEVIAVRPWGQTQVPSYLIHSADKVVGFNSKAIINYLKTS